MICVVLLFFPDLGLALPQVE